LILVTLSRFYAKNARPAYQQGLIVDRRVAVPSLNKQLFNNDLLCVFAEEYLILRTKNYMKQE